MYSSSLVCITGNYWLAAGSRSLRDLEQGPGRFATFRGRGGADAEHDADPAPRRIKPLGEGGALACPMPPFLFELGC